MIRSFIYRVFAGSVVGLAACLPALADSGGGTNADDLKQLSIEQLMDVQVTSVSKRSESVADAPAAVYVITHEDIQRSGATSLPEILRLAPNLQVYQVSATSYTVTARGFNGNSADQNFSDKLLMLIDGRSVYSPLYSGVFWDSQDVLIEDIDRIEVISGPGATLWGANAMNGVINIITRKSSQTAGAMAQLAYGNEERNAAAQFGADAGNDLSYRLYGQSFQRDAQDLASGGSAGDSWAMAQTGFRSDWTDADDVVTLEGDGYHGHERQPGQPDLDLDGGNLTGHWQRALDGGLLDVLGYFDESQRESAGGSGFKIHSFDLEFQHSFDLGGWNSIVWGVGDRISRYDIDVAGALQFQPADRTLHLSDVFGQDTLRLSPAVHLTFGLKLENDPFTGTTPLPDARLSWKLSEDQFLWAAVSYAIRSATPFDRDVKEYLSNVLFLVGSPQFRSEKLTAYELGWRAALGSQVSLSVSTFYNRYSELRTIDIDPTTIIPLEVGNGMRADTFGAELWGEYQVREGWRLAFGYTEQREHFSITNPYAAFLGLSQAGSDPPRLAQLHSYWDLGSRLTLDTFLRYTGPLPDPAIAAYGELNARLGWRLSDHWTLALTGSNLLHAHHQEYAASSADAISRSVLVSVEAKL